MAHCIDSNWEMVLSLAGVGNITVIGCTVRCDNRVIKRLLEHWERIVIIGNVGDKLGITKVIDRSVVLSEQ